MKTLLSKNVNLLLLKNTLKLLLQTICLFLAEFADWKTDDRISRIDTAAAHSRDLYFRFRNSSWDD